MINIADMDERQLAEKKRADAIGDKIRAAIKILGFDLHQSDNDMNCYRTAQEWTLPNAEGMTLHFRQGYGSQHNRISIGASYPKTAKGEYIRPTDYNETRKDEISVSGDKTAEQIASDVTRRLMPVALEYLACVKKQIASSDDYDATTEATLTALKGAPLTEHEKASNSIDIKEAWHHTATVSKKEVSLKLNYLDLETALKIIALLPKERAEEV